MLNIIESIVPGCVGVADNEDGTYRVDFADKESRLATKEEMDAVEAHLQAEAAKRQEADIARDDAKRALSALDTIIAGAPTATTAQLRAAVEQMARIQKHIILAILGR